jgi:hypothetical protein
MQLIKIPSGLQTRARHKTLDSHITFKLDDNARAARAIELALARSSSSSSSMSGNGLSSAREPHNAKDEREKDPACSKG